MRTRYELPRRTGVPYRLRTRIAYITGRHSRKKTDTDSDGPREFFLPFSFSPHILSCGEPSQSAVWFIRNHISQSHIAGVVVTGGIKVRRGDFRGRFPFSHSMVVTEKANFSTLRTGGLPGEIPYIPGGESGARNPPSSCRHSISSPDRTVGTKCVLPYVL